MKSSWKNLYISSSIFLKILDTRANYRSLFYKKNRKSDKAKSILKKNFKIDHQFHNLRNSTIVKRMLPFSFDIYNGVKGRVTSKVRKKGKQMNKFKIMKTIDLSRTMLGHKLGEFTLNRNFIKHTLKKKKK